MVLTNKFYKLLLRNKHTNSSHNNIIHNKTLLYKYEVKF
jgi:hypothetical protein